MGGLIQKRLKDQALAEGGTYVGAKDQGSTDKVKYNRAREQWKGPIPAFQRKPSGEGGATAMRQGWVGSTSQQQGKLLPDLRRKLNKISASDSSEIEKAGKKPHPPSNTAKPQHQQPKESQPLYGKAGAEDVYVYGEVDFGHHIFVNTEFETDQISEVTINGGS